ASHRRALWHAGPGFGGDGDRDGADRLRHARRTGRQGGVGARHRLRRGDDRVQRHRRLVPARGPRHHEQGFQLQGASAALAVLAALTGLTLILPNFASPELGPRYNTPQLIFAGIVSLVLYGSFVFIQTVRHRDYFLPAQAGDEEEHAPAPPNRTALVSAGLLVVSLVVIVGLAKILTPWVELGIAYLGVGKSGVGII